MSKTYRVVIIGFAHMHINDVAAGFYANPRIRLVACADTRPLAPELAHGPYTRGWNLQFAKTHFGAPRVYGDYVEMLAQEKPDLAIITSENAYHPAIVRACAERGVGVCIEKPMAMTLNDALDMARSLILHKGFGLVNWPITWRPYLHQMKALIDEGAIGRVVGLQYRAGHTGPLGPGAKHRGVTESADSMTSLEKSRTWWHQKQCGGGAMLDLCCYGSLFSAWMIDRPALSVMGMKANTCSAWGEVEDNASMLVQFDGAIATVEGTWTTPQRLAQAGPIVYGEEGTLTCLKTEDGVFVQRTALTGEVETYPAATMPAHFADASDAYVHAMDTGEPLHETLAIGTNLRAMAILDAGLRSAESGRAQWVRDAMWHA